MDEIEHGFREESKQSLAFSSADVQSAQIYKIECMRILDTTLLRYCLKYLFCRGLILLKQLKDISNINHILFQNLGL